MTDDRHVRSYNRAAGAHLHHAREKNMNTECAKICNWNGTIFRQAVSGHPEVLSLAKCIIVGALNWGLIGAFHVNVVTMLFGDTSTITRVLYTLIGLAGLYKIFMIATKK